MALTCDIWFENQHYRTMTENQTLAYGCFSLINAFQKHIDMPEAALHQVDTGMYVQFIFLQKHIPTDYKKPKQKRKQRRNHKTTFSPGINIQLL